MTDFEGLASEGYPVLMGCRHENRSGYYEVRIQVPDYNDAFATQLADLAAAHDENFAMSGGMQPCSDCYGTDINTPATTRAILAEHAEVEELRKVCEYAAKIPDGEVEAAPEWLRELRHHARQAMKANSGGPVPGEDFDPQQDHDERMQQAADDEQRYAGGEG